MIDWMRAAVLSAGILGFCLVTGAPTGPRSTSAVPASDDTTRRGFAVALHGGAGSSIRGMSEDSRRQYEHALADALKIGVDALAGGRPSVETVERVICYLEDNPLFNAGRGAVLNRDGHVQLDASIMDGRKRACGAVAAVRRVRNPVSLARLVMTKSRHVMLVADGAEAFAAEMKLGLADEQYFTTAHRKRQWTAARIAAGEAAAEGETVGCVALDRFGNLAAGTSTGGRVYKRPSRVGDSPVIGAGTFADNDTCAVSCTGNGEQFLRHVIAYDVHARMTYQRATLAQAVRAVIHERLQPGDGGMIAIGQDGTIVMEFNTAGMFRGAADATGRFEVAVGPKP